MPTLVFKGYCFPSSKSPASQSGLEDICVSKVVNTGKGGNVPITYMKLNDITVYRWNVTKAFVTVLKMVFLFKKLNSFGFDMSSSSHVRSTLWQLKLKTWTEPLEGGQQQALSPSMS